MGEGAAREQTGRGAKGEAVVMGRLPLRGRLPRYRRVDDTSVILAAICFPGDQVMQRQGLGWAGQILWAGSRRR